MPFDWRLYQLYKGAALRPTTIKTVGEGFGNIGSGDRGPMLAPLVNQGKLKAQDLSPQDASAAGGNMSKTGGAGGFLGLGHVWNAAKNLGSDIASAAAG